MAAAEAEEPQPAKAEAAPANQPFSRFQVVTPMQASPGAHSTLVQRSPSVMPATLPSAPVATSAAAVATSAPSPQTPSGPGPVVTQTMSPVPRPLRQPTATFAFAEREGEPIPVPQAVAQAQRQPVRISQKEAPVPSSSMPSASEAMPRSAGWISDANRPPMPLLSQQQDVREIREIREGRERQVRMEPLQPREQTRPMERPAMRFKQEPEQPIHHGDPFQNFMPPQRSMQPRVEAAPMGRQDPPRAMAPPTSQSYTPPIQAQPVRNLLSESVPSQRTPPQLSPAMERPPVPSTQRSVPSSMQEQYPANTSGAQSVPPPQAPPAASHPPEQKKVSSIFSLLNDAGPPPSAPAPKRVNDVASMPGVPSTSTPPPQQMSARPPQPQTATASTSQRRDVEAAGYPYARNPPSAAQAAIPSLKPFHTSSPQPQHMNVPRSSMGPGMEQQVSAAGDNREFYSRHQYQPQHQPGTSNSPVSHQVHHYSQSAQHPQQLSQQHLQQPQMAYSSQQQYQAYATSQAHAASPTPQYAPHPSSLSGRREAPSAREEWSSTQQGQAAVPSLQQRQQQQQQQQGGWPPSHTPSKSSQASVPSQTAWAAQHGPNVQAKPPQMGSAMSQQQHSWQATPTQQSHSLGLREPTPRGQAVYSAHEAQSPTGSVVSHQHHRSLDGRSQFPPMPDPRDRPNLRRGEPVPPQGQPYARYVNTPGPGHGGPGGPPGQVPGRGEAPADIRMQQMAQARSYTPGPVSAGFDGMGPPPSSSLGYPEQIRDAQIRDAQLREMGSRDLGRDHRVMGRDPRELGRDPREVAAAQQREQHAAQFQAQQQHGVPANAAHPQHIQVQGLPQQHQMSQHQQHVQQQPMQHDMRNPAQVPHQQYAPQHHQGGMMGRQLRPQHQYDQQGHGPGPGQGDPRRAG